MKKLQIIRHGEVILKPVSSIPENAKKEKSTKEYIVAHSETGHHHILTGLLPFVVYNSGNDVYLEVKDDARLWHNKTGKDVHAEHNIAPSVYKVIIKKHFDYFRGALERVRD